MNICFGSFFLAIKRFYACVRVNQAEDETASSSESPNTYEITLDRKKLKTPARHVFQVDNPGVAYTVGAEWAAQGKTIAQSSMHLVNCVHCDLKFLIVHTSQAIMDTKLNIRFFFSYRRLYRIQLKTTQPEKQNLI